MKNFRTRLARRLRFAADRLDPTTGPRLMTAVRGFTFEDGIGVVFRDDGRGCPLWFMAEDYDRAHDEAGDLKPGKWWGRRDRPQLSDYGFADPATRCTCRSTGPATCPTPSHRAAVEHTWSTRRPEGVAVAKLPPVLRPDAWPLPDPAVETQHLAEQQTAHTAQLVQTIRDGQCPACGEPLTDIDVPAGETGGRCTAHGLWHTVNGDYGAVGYRHEVPVPEAWQRPPA